MATARAALAQRGQAFEWGGIRPLRRRRLGQCQGKQVWKAFECASPLERVRHFRSDLVTWRDDKTQAIPDGCFGRGIEFRRSVPDLDDRRRTAAPIRAARNVQCVALDGASRCSMADVADQLPTVGTGLPANATLAECGLLRGDGERSAFDHPGCTGPAGAAQCGYPGWTHFAV